MLDKLLLHCRKCLTPVLYFAAMLPTGLPSHAHLSPGHSANRHPVSESADSIPSRSGALGSLTSGWQQESEGILEQENARLSDEVRHRRLNRVSTCVTSRLRSLATLTELDSVCFRTLELERLAREAEGLREQIREEQQRRQSRVADLTEQLLGVQGCHIAAHVVRILAKIC